MSLVGLAASGILGLAFAASASAVPAGEPTPVSLEDALRLGDLHSPLVRRAQAETTVVAAHDVGASLILPSNPIVAVVAGSRREPAPPNGVQRSLQCIAHLEQTIEVAGQRGARRAVVRQSLDVAASREALARSETRARVRTAFMKGLITAAQARAARAPETIVDQLFEAVRVVIQASRDVGEARRAQLAAIQDFWHAVVEPDRASGAL